MSFQEENNEVSPLKDILTAILCTLLCVSTLSLCIFHPSYLYWVWLEVIPALYRKPYATSFSDRTFAFFDNFSLFFLLVSVQIIMAIALRKRIRSLLILSSVITPMAIGSIPLGILGYALIVGGGTG